MDHSSSADHFIPFPENNDSKFSKPLPRKTNSKETFSGKTEHNGNPHLHNLKPVTKTIKKESHAKRGYTFISDEVRHQLIEAVHINGERINCAAKRLGINYSAAKAIYQVYKREGRSNKKVPNRHVFPRSIRDSDRSFATDSEKPEILKKEADEMTLSQESFPDPQSTDQLTYCTRFVSMQAKPTKIVPIYITNPVIGQALPNQHFQVSDPSLGYFKPQVSSYPHYSYQDLVMRSQSQKTYIFTPAFNIASSSNLNSPSYMLNSVYYMPVYTEKLNASSTSVSQDLPSGYDQLSRPSNLYLDQPLIVTDSAMPKDLLLFRKNLL